MFVPFIQEDLPSVLFLICVTVFVLLLSMGILATAIRIIPEYARVVIFRLGRFVGVVGPGLVFVLPFVDRAIQVDLREKKETINGEASSQENIRLNFQMNLGYRILTPEKSILNVPDLNNAVREAARSQLKSIVGGLTHENVIHDRTGLETALKTRLTETMEAWGCEVKTVEILDVQRN